MKNIELTEIHQDKLLKMCKVLFPEYVEIDFDKSGILTLWKEKCPSIGWFEICWFEFCWKILNKILSNTETISPVYVQECIINFGMICFNNSEFQHPIDHLYEIFKQYEKN